ncbi:MAG: AMP-binding protein [Gammaproteobacteria bacterium]|nr:AMP-binding protein [Gammaproteobacteria bacterium]
MSAATPQSLWALVEPSFSIHQDRSAWIRRLSGGKREHHSYQEIETAVLDAADRMREQGVGAGDIVAIRAPNGPEWGITGLAAWRVGAIVAPLHTGSSTSELSRQLESLQPKRFLTWPSLDALPGQAELIQVQRDPQRINRERQQKAGGAPEAEAVRMYTSGSTGTPKVVRLSHANIISNVLTATTCVHIRPHERFLSLLPLSHMMEITGGLFLALYTGSTMVLPRVLAAAEIIAALGEERISVLIAVPRLFRNIMIGMEKKLGAAGGAMRAYRALLRASPPFLRKHLNAPVRRKLGGRITAWVSGGARLDPDITLYFQALGFPLRQGYGLTETSPLLSVQDEFEAHVESVGRPIQGCEVRIADPDASGSGELLVRGDNLMMGYLDPRHNAEAMQDGWFHSGDIARLENGKIFITGRSKRLIVTEAGKNVYPEELETLLERMPGVTEAAVIEMDLKPVALLAVEGDEPEARARQILREFNAQAASHNQISRFALVEEMPKTPVGKVALPVLPEVFVQREVRRTG